MRLFIRTEASPQIGMGHFMRCFAIAEEACAQGVVVTFLLNEIGEAVQARLVAIGASGVVVAGPLGSVEDFMALNALGLTRQDWLLIDSYAANEDYIEFQARAAKVAVLDDLNALEGFACDLIINPAQAARSIDYERKTQARLLLGADYALIRQEFLNAVPLKRKKSTVTILFGGSDPTQVTGRCAQILHKALPDTDIYIVAGPANVHTDELIQLEQKLNNVTLFPSPQSVADVLAGSALVITAAGGSVGEVAAMGLPALVLVVYDNQRAALEACPFPVIDAREGLPADLGARVKALMEAPDRLVKIAASAHAVVDGKGPQRIVEALLNV